MVLPDNETDRNNDRWEDTSRGSAIRVFPVGDVQVPLPTDGDSVYEKDIWVEESDSTNWITGGVVDLFNNLHTEMQNVTVSSPKVLFIHFNRTIVSNAIGLGASLGLGDFSNTKIEIVNSGGISTTVIDESSDNTKYTTRTFQLPVTAGFNAIRLTFSTTDTVTLTNCVILKSRSVVSRGQAVKPDGTVIDLNATAGGNQKFSLEEYDEAVDPIRKDVEGLGKISIGTTSTEIVFVGTPTHTIMIRADKNNTGLLFIGKSDVLSTGANAITYLEAGDIFTDNYDDSDNPYYIVSDTASQNYWAGANL